MVKTVLSSSQLFWYWQRALAMSPQEVSARLKFAYKKRSWRSCSSWQSPQPLLNHQDVWHLPTLPPEIAPEKNALIAEANCYLEGKYTLLNLTFCEPHIDWHLDPQTGVKAPLEFGLDLNYRDLSVAGNVKNIWEKNRHHHLSVMALAYTLTNQEQYAIAVEEQLKSWVKANPFPWGVNWNSALELGVRLIAWVWIERLLRGSQSHQHLFGEGGCLWDMIYWHQWLINQHPSPGSSANNHLIGEMAGLLIAACVWPVFPESKQWREYSQQILEQEICRQTFPSGLNREQAFAYQIFVSEFFLLAGIEAEGSGLTWSSNYRERVRRMLEVIPPLLDCQGNVPQYGDGDEGMALQLRPLNSPRFPWLWRLGRQWLAAQVPLPPSGEGLLASTIINSGKEDRVGDIAAPHSSVGFADAGLFVLASERGTNQEILCLADGGVLGYLSLAAHGHADALSFTLNVGGVPILVDPGTYTYHAQPQWRNYLRSTKAHNTIVVDNLDQSEPAGTFLWGKKAQVKVLSWQPQPDGGILRAEHDGYTRLPQPVKHLRQLSLQGQQLEIVDHLEGNSIHHYQWRLHFSPVCQVKLQGEDCLVTWETGKLIINLDQQMQWSLAKAESDGGWYSSGFNLKEPTYTLIGSACTQLSVHLKNCLRVCNEN